MSVTPSLFSSIPTAKDALAYDGLFTLLVESSTKLSLHPPPTSIVHPCMAVAVTVLVAANALAKSPPATANDVTPAKTDCLSFDFSLVTPDRVYLIQILLYLPH